MYTHRLCGFVSTATITVMLSSETIAINSETIRIYLLPVITLRFVHNGVQGQRKAVYAHQSVGLAASSLKSPSMLSHQYILTVLAVFCMLAAQVHAVGGNADFALPPAPATLWNNPWTTQGIDCQRTNWMHTAKTGSTFCLAIQHVCCPAAFQKLTDGITMDMMAYSVGSYYNKTHAGFRFDAQYCYRFIRDGYEPIRCTFAGRPEHLPLRPTVDLTQLMGLLIVREPKSRIISAFLDGYHLEGFVNRTLGYEMKQEFKLIDRDNQTTKEEKLLKKAQMYCYHPELYGHQVKMLLGMPIIDLSTPTPAHVEKVVALALRRLRQYFFVGIFDEYARSLRVFHELANVGESLDIAIVCVYIRCTSF